jgi:uncharacterized protein YdeI (YjbR/CyaY-like superfamily)
MEIEPEIYCPANKQEWRNWLEQNHKAKAAVWLVLHKKESNTKNLNWSEAVDEALCYGWIDSVKKAIDSKTYKQYFGKRQPNSTWSKVNKKKVEALIDAGLMTESGLKSIEIAKQNGSWSILDSVENTEIPADLDTILKRNPEARAYFLGLSKSVKKAILQWLVLAKRPETRQKRIDEIAENALEKRRPKQFR